MWDSWFIYENPDVELQMEKWTPFFGLTHFCVEKDYHFPCFDQKWGQRAMCRVENYFADNTLVASLAHRPQTIWMAPISTILIHLNIHKSCTDGSMTVSSKLTLKYRQIVHGCNHTGHIMH